MHELTAAQTTTDATGATSTVGLHVERRPTYAGAACSGLVERWARSVALLVVEERRLDAQQVRLGVEFFVPVEHGLVATSLE